MISRLFKRIEEYLLDSYYKIPEEKAPEEAKKDPKKDVCQIEYAKIYHGKHEVSDNAELKALLKFDPAKTPWCAGFVNAIERLCGRKGTEKLTARSFLNYGKQVNLPKKGDIVVFKRGKLPWQGHVGYFIQQDKNGILVLGGNQSNKVCYKYYPKSALLGYRRP